MPTKLLLQPSSSESVRLGIVLERHYNEDSLVDRYFSVCMQEQY